MGKTLRYRKTLNITIGSVGAALYAILILPVIVVTLGPLGIANLRPAIVIPMVISSVFGPLAGSLTAAFGNSIADLITYGPHPGTIPGFAGSGIGAVVTAIFAMMATKWLKGAKRIGVVAFGSAVGLGWITGLIVGVGNLLMGYIPSIEVALTVGAIIGVGNTIWAFTILPPVEISVRKLAKAKGLISD